MGPDLRPRDGSYAVTGRLPDGRVLKGAANLGVRPSFDPPQELLEPHFFDFSGDLYGQDIDVAFHAFIRAEAKFDSMDALTAQIASDCNAAKALLTDRSEEHTSELQSLMRISYAVFCMKKKTKQQRPTCTPTTTNNHTVKRKK